MLYCLLLTIYGLSPQICLLLEAPWKHWLHIPIWKAAKKELCPLNKEVGKCLRRCGHVLSSSMVGDMLDEISTQPWKALDRHCPSSFSLILIYWLSLILFPIKVGMTGLAEGGPHLHILRALQADYDLAGLDLNFLLWVDDQGKQPICQSWLVPKESFMQRLFIVMPFHSTVVGCIPALTQPLSKQQHLKQQTPRLCSLEQVQEVGVYLWWDAEKMGMESKASSKVLPSSYSLDSPIHLSFRFNCRIFKFFLLLSSSKIITLQSQNTSNLVIILILGNMTNFKV